MSDNKITARNDDRILGSGVPGKEVKSTGKLWLKPQGSGGGRTSVKGGGNV